jgi:hypothetical protein
VLWLSSAGVNDPVSDTRDYYEGFLAYRNSDVGAKISRTIVGTRYNAPLAEARGKIVIIEDFGCTSCGLDGKAYTDDPSIPNRDGGSTFFATAASMNSLWGYISSQFAVIDSGLTERMYQNSLAASGGLYPMDAATGFLGIDGMNSRTLRHLFAGSQNRTTGLLWMDAPGPALISAVIAENLKFATNISLIRDDFENIFEEISYAATGDGNDKSADHATQLQDYLQHILPEQHWSVLVSATLGSDNWGFSVEPEGLYHKTDWIDGYSHVAVNALQVNADISAAEISAYLTPERLASLSGDAVGRAAGARTLLESHFPWARWNVAVKRWPFDPENWATELDSAASVSLPSADDGELYLYTVWATSGINRAPVANAGGPYEANEGSTITFDASASSDPDGDALHYRWDLNGDGSWDTISSTDPTAHGTYNDNGTFLAKVEVSDNALTTVATVSVKVHNVAPTLDAGGAATIFGGLALTRECHILDPGNDTWSVEIRYGDGSRTNLLHPQKTFVIQHAYPGPGDYDVEIFVSDDDGDSGFATFHVQAGVNSPPTPVDDWIEIGTVTAGTEIKLSIAKLLHNDTDPDSDPLTLKDFDPLSANQQSVRRDGDALYYRVPAAPVEPDSFNYTVADSAGAMGTATVHIVPVKIDPTSNIISLTQLPSGTVRLLFVGVPGRSYIVQATDSLNKPDWTNLGTVMAEANGFVTFEDTEAPSHLTRYYRCVSVQNTLPN